MFESLTMRLLLNVELIDFKTRRVAAFRKNLVELAELELKHAKVPMSLWGQLPAESGEESPWVRVRVIIGLDLGSLREKILMFCGVKFYG